MSIERLVAAMQAFREALRGTSEAFSEFAFLVALAGALTAREARRIVRDRARATRRPALIYNGRKARE